MAIFRFPLNVVLIVCTLSTLRLAGTTDTSLTDGGQQTDNRRCYACTSLDEDNSQCEMDPAAVPHGVLDPCPRQVCTIVRVEEWPSRRVKSFYRGCDGLTKVFERNHCQVERDERTCFSACVGDLCNAGNGIVADDNGNSLSSTSSSSVTDSSTLLVGSLLIAWTPILGQRL